MVVQIILNVSLL